MKNSIIREYINRTDREAVIRLWKLCFPSDEPRHQPELNLELKLKQNDGLLFVALSDQKITGTVMAGYDGHRGWLYSVAVDPDFRNHGIGTSLLRHAEKELKKRGCPKINLQITASNSAVVSFYEKNGYKVEERISMGKTVSEK